MGPVIKVTTDTFPYASDYVLFLMQQNTDSQDSRVHAKG